jgi:hypothetical protein
MKIIENIKDFYNEHKFACRLAGVIILGSVGAYAGYKAYKRSTPKRIGDEKIFDADITVYMPKGRPNRKQVAEIDEDIFTNIAPWIEMSIFEEGVDESVFENTYTVSFPKGGDAANGMYDVLKKVKILVQDVGDAE